MLTSTLSRVNFSKMRTKTKFNGIIKKNVKLVARKSILSIRVGVSNQMSFRWRLFQKSLKRLLLTYLIKSKESLKNEMLQLSMLTFKLNK